MQTINFFRKSNFVALLFTAGLFFGGCKNELDQQPSPQIAEDANARVSAQTAQSVMVKIADLGGNYQIVGEEVWEFDQKSADVTKYFSGGTANDKQNAAQQNRCNFWSGAQLTGTNKCTVDPTIARTEKTGWTLKSSTVAGATITVPVSFDIAAQSVMKNSKNELKYDFSLSADRFGSTGSEVAMTITIKNAAAEVVQTVDVLKSQLTYIKGAAAGAVFYSAEPKNYFGKNTELLKNDATISAIIANSSLSKFRTANDNNAVVASVSTGIELPEGEYTLTVSGIIKGNETSADGGSFQVTETLTIDAQNCE